MNQTTKNILKQLEKKQVYFFDKLLSFKKLCKIYNIDSQSCFVICDKKLKSKINLWFKGEWIYFVQAGESLKSIDNFSYHSKKILKKISSLNTSPSCFIGIGGGSITDFTGFFSSIYKRGRPVFYFPSTLLSALDASHGGKTALNVSNVKNYLGTYHFPSGVFIFKNLIKDIQKDNLLSSNGELVKTAFIERSFLYKQLKRKFSVSFENIWPLIPWTVKIKLDLIEKDPFEKKNQRRWLNLGHSLGHCLESYYKLPHGQAVALGIAFSICWSVKKYFLSATKAKELMDILNHYTDLSSLPPVPKLKLEKLIREDKKIRNDQSIDFVFLKNSRNPIIHSVSVQEFIFFYQDVKNNFYTQFL